MANNVTTIELKDLRKMIRELRQLDSTYVSAFYKEAREIAKPIQADIVRAIPASAPLSGMRPRSERGRLAWGAGRRAKSVVIRVKRRISRGSAFSQGRAKAYPIVQVAARSPALVMADMAGSSNKVTNKRPQSRKHEINLFGRGEIVERTYPIRGQGIGMIRALSAGVKGARAKPSRWFWPAADKGWETAQEKMGKLIEDTNEMINKKLGT